MEPLTVVPPFVESFDHYCQKCELKEPEKIKEREQEIDESLESIKNYPEYEELKVEAEQLKRRFHEVGYDCANNLLVIGRK